PLGRQIGQVWALFFAGVLLMGVVLQLEQVPVQKILPLAVLQCAVALGCMAAILGGSFYWLAAVAALLALVLAVRPREGPLVFGAVFAAGLFWTGHKYARGQAQAAPAARRGGTTTADRPPAGSTLSMPGRP